MKTLRKMNHKGLMALAVLAILLPSLMTLAQGPKSKRTALPPPPQVDMLVMPPVPGEDDILDTAFNRYPEANREEVMAFLKEQLPEEVYAFKLRAMRRREDAIAYMANLIRETLRLMQTRQSSPELFQKVVRQRTLEQQATRLADSARHAKGDQRANYLTQLEKTLLEAFQIKQEMMKLDVAHMEGELEQLRVLLDRREENERAIVGRRIAELTGDMDYLQW